MVKVKVARKGKKNGSRMAKKVVEVAVATRGRRRRNRNGGNGSGAPVSTSVSIAPRNTERVHLKGTDRLIHVDDVSKFGTGATVVDLSLSCSSFKRMEHMASAYQRVRFKKLVFRVVPMSATSSSGGFAAAFVSDPTDVLGSGDDALDRLVAQKGSKITKIWQSTTVNACLLPDLLYTSEPPQGDIRLSSPGRLWIIIESKVVGNNNSPVPLTVYCDWEVDFYVPSLEKGEKGGSGSLVVGATFYTKKTAVGLWWQDDSPGDDPRTKIPNIEFDVTYQTKQKYYLSYEKAGNFDKFRMVHDKVHGITLAPVAPDGTIIIEKTDINQYVFEKGDVLTPVSSPNSVGVEYLCRMTRKPISQALCQSLPAPSLLRSSQIELPSETLRQSSTPSQTPNSLHKGLTPARLKALETEFRSLLQERSRSPSFETLDGHFEI